MFTFSKKQLSFLKEKNTYEVGFIQDKQEVFRLNNVETNNDG